jgi:hypothetical protein
LYVLSPVLDDQKHYWVGDDEVEKLLRHGEGWLDKHPSRDVIVSRYLVHQRGLVRDAYRPPSPRLETQHVRMRRDVTEPLERRQRELRCGHPEGEALANQAGQFRLMVERI